MKNPSAFELFAEGAVVLGVAAALIMVALFGVGACLQAIWEAWNDNRGRCQPGKPSSSPAPAPAPLPLPPRPTTSSLTPVTTLRNAMVSRGISAIEMAEEVTQLFQAILGNHATCGSHIAVSIVFSPAGFAEIFWKAHGYGDYFPRVKCYRDGVLMFSECAAEGMFGDVLEPGNWYRFRFEICSDQYPNAKPIDDIERYVIVPTREMLLATVKDADSHSVERLFATHKRRSAKSRTLRERVDELCDDD